MSGVVTLFSSLCSKMASRLLCRQIFSSVRRAVVPPAATGVRHMAVGGVPTDEEQATGLEKRELDAKKAGIADPFSMEINTTPPGTRDSPCQVPSIYERRLVGCVCEEDATYIQWMWLEKGDAQRCECGHWFQLQGVTPPGAAEAH
ncbi:cytochrome c oxidase subunit 5B, mitochondrial-like isoform X1 [Branchiostoma lanceolatum]|uniref:cytochrome c oxidase subunit 5B, mitochondrial-like isoform X1 n=1 Tax=Branchiostoma lanceolatum TaxID=7740 RepID=UPI003452DED0